MTDAQCVMWGCVPCQLCQALWCLLAVAHLGAKRSLQSGWFLCRESEMTCRWARMFQPCRVYAQDTVNRNTAGTI